MVWPSRFPTKFPFKFGYVSRRPTFLPAAPAAKVIGDTQIVSVHTNTGVQLYQFLGSELIDLTWSRDLRATSRCEVTVSSELDYNRLPDLVPWQHWVSVWDETGQTLYWTGPIQKVAATRESVVISARDVSSLLTRTRCPMTKRWDTTDPADVAGELWRAMAEHHGLNIAPIVRYDPLGDKFDFKAVADEQLLDKLSDELVGFGLYWTVVSGTPVMGPMPRDPVAALGETDFVGGGITVVRDGSQFHNDVLLRSGDAVSRARVPLGTLNLQTIVNIDSMFGVSNTDRAVKQYARYVSTIRDTVILPSNSVLHPYAPVSIDQLVPSARLVVDAYGVLVLMQLTGVDVTYTSETSSVSIRMESVDDELPELVTIQEKDSMSGVGA